jgi:hypothetical protein
MKRGDFCLAAAVILGSSPAIAQPLEASPPPSSTPASTTPAPLSATGPPSTAAVADAQARFRRALELHDEGNLDAARTELRRAYETAPNYKVLFNLAQVEFELLDYPGALATFEKYLTEGGDRIPKERRAQVQSDIEKLRGRLGSIEIAVNVAGARVTVDDVSVGTTPLLHPVLVGAGRRRITVSRAGFATEIRVVDVAGGDHSATSFELADAAHLEAASPGTSPVAPEATAPAAAPPEAPPPPPGTDTRSVPWVGWVATALLAGGAGIAGGLALQRSQQLGSVRVRYGVDPSELVRLQNEATALAVASDICAGGAAFAGILSLYLTLSSNGERKTEQGRAVRVSPSLGFVSVEGSF